MNFIFFLLVYLLARQVFSPDIDWSYVESTEMLTAENSEH